MRRASRPPSSATWRPCSGPACSPGTSARRPFWHATTGSTRRGWRFSVRSSACSRHPSPTKRRRWRGYRRRSGSKTSTTASALSSTSRVADVRLFSRDLHDISSQFPEVLAAARDLPWDGILDGEILGWRDGVALPFLQLQARLGRKAPSAADPVGHPCHLCRRLTSSPSGTVPARPSSPWSGCRCESGANASNGSAWTPRPASGWQPSLRRPTWPSWRPSSRPPSNAATRA